MLSEPHIRQLGDRISQFQNPQEVIQPTWTAELCLRALQHLTGCPRFKIQTQNQLQTISTKSNSNSQGPPRVHTAQPGGRMQYNRHLQNKSSESLKLQDQIARKARIQQLNIILK
jgi:hypothetical protein